MCYRSRNERFNWLNFSNTQKQEVLRLCKQRAKRKRSILLSQQHSQSTQESPQISLTL
ncbi:putative oxidoreductase [Gilliamella apicola]|nr:putative oxidoreductase [Gilliamella apicola]